MAYVVCARWTAREGEAERVEAAIRKLAPPSREEPGMILYQPHRDPENPNVFFFYERYESPEAYQAHLDSEHFRRYGLGEAKPLLESREREFYETLDI